MSSYIIKIWLSVFQLILKLIHFAYSVYEYFDLEWLLLRRKFKDFLHLPVFDSQMYVSEFVRKLDKCPSHFVVIVGEDGISVKDFSNLVMWCLAAKISFVSFYDYSGYLKANEHTYYKYLIDKRKIDPKCLIFDLEKLNSKNEVLHKIHLNILSLQNGKPLFVELAKKISQSVISNKLNISEINEQLISSELLKFIGLPEPDLGIVCGNIFSTFGFLPWHIRITEFLFGAFPMVAISVKDTEWSQGINWHYDSKYCCFLLTIYQFYLFCLKAFMMFSSLKKLTDNKPISLTWQIKSLREIKVSEFTSVLMAYSSCTQRFGK